MCLQIQTTGRRLYLITIMNDKMYDTEQIFRRRCFVSFSEDNHKTEKYTHYFSRYLSLKFLTLKALKELFCFYEYFNNSKAVMIFDVVLLIYLM